jgi:hypothetical protein
MLDFIKEWLRRDMTGCPRFPPVASASYGVIVMLAEIVLQSGAIWVAMLMKLKY